MSDRLAPAAGAGRPAAGGARRAVAGMVVATALWGGTFVVIRDSLRGVDPVSLVFARFAAAAGLFSLLVLPRARSLDRTAALGGALCGALAAGGYLFQAIGLTATSAGTSAFLTSTGTLFAGFFAWPLLGQRPSPALTAGIAIAIAGSALMAPPGALRLGPGEAWTLLGALVYALQIVALGRFAPRADPIALTGVQALVIALVLGPFAAAARDPIASLAGAGWWRLGYLVVAASVLAPLLQVVAQRTLPPGRVGLLFALEPLFALGFAITVGAERYAARWWGGAGLILLAVWMVERRASRVPTGSPPPSG